MFDDQQFSDCKSVLTVNRYLEVSLLVNLVIFWPPIGYPEQYLRHWLKDPNKSYSLVDFQAQGVFDS